MTGNSDNDGGPWGLGRWSQPPSTPSYPDCTFPQEGSVDSRLYAHTRPVYPPPPSPVNYPPVYPPYPPNQPHGSSPYAPQPAQGSSAREASYDQIADPTAEGSVDSRLYAHTRPVYPPPPSPVNYPPVYPPYPPNQPHGSSPYAPQPAQGSSARGASYDQIADPTAPYYQSSTPGYLNPPSHMQGGGTYSQPGPYSTPSVTPQMQDSGGTQYGNLEPEGYGPGAGSGHFRTNSLRLDPNPRPYAGGPYEQNESEYTNGSYIQSQQPPVCYSGPIYSNDPGMTGATQSQVLRNTTDMIVSEKGHHSMTLSLLHGTLDVTIFEAVRLPNMDIFSEKLRVFASNLPAPLEMAKAKARLHAPNVAITSDPYATVVLAGARVARTRVISNDVNPKWNEHFSIPVAHYVHHIAFTVKDQDVLGTQYIGDIKIPVEQVLYGGVVDGWFDLVNAHGKPCHEGAKLRLSVRYVPVEQNLIYTQGVGSDSHGVPHTYFPLRKGCRLTLYQDTHIYDNTLPDIALDGGMVYKHGRCWEEMCTAINDAQHLVYITGWSVYDKIKLVRDCNRPVPEGGNLTLGELLKKKASQGVRVLLLVWDDKTSHDCAFVKTNGVMNTHDEETKNFFKNTGVRCVLASRYGASKMSWFRQRVVGTLYSHHQKTTIVDSGPRGQRTLTSFIGGLDLCGGRWDTPSHYLFASLQNEHKNDFRNKSWAYLPDSGGPREPWHDWHCKIEGHAAYDVLTNFEQRWRKATRTYDDELLDIERCDHLLGPSNRAPIEGDPALFVNNDCDPETWHVQVLRSIDAGSVKGFPTTVDEVQKQHLVWGKSVAIDTSIQMAYIKAIRSAQHFIYIENQYFLGSSYNWPDYDTAGANHLIPMELALKICSKIREGKRFTVYVVIPMWPEGIPDSGPVQEILYFQTQTMKMMYARVADALRDMGLLHRKPTDYLNFYCLGNRETKKPGEPAPLKPLDVKSRQGLSQKNRRMMIYVHAKGMIVDDELVIMGSANINQRSMDGSRDTEIAMGGYQPHHTWVRKMAHPRGQVYGYRMSLWAEHLGLLEPTFEEPESLECVRRVNDMAERNWQQYIAPEVTDMRGHLIRYPLFIGDDGEVTNLPGFETFPDVGGKIMGCNQPNIPDDLTA